MKYIIQYLLICLLVLLSLQLFSQNIPQGFTYQTVIRDIDTDLPLINAEVELAFNIRDNHANGAVVYQETITKTTDQFGLINHVIGQGTPGFIDFSDINWSINPKFLEVAVNIGGNFQSLGAIQLWSVPFALYAQNTLGSSGEGTLWLIGSMDPNNDQGSDNDLYLNNTSGDYFRKLNNEWSLVGNLQGPAGADGVPGAPGAPGTPGMNGIDGTNGVDGMDGAGITQITSNGDGTLTIEYGNGNSVTTDDLTGPAGSMGVAGVPGVPGMDGADGAGITQITSNGDGTLTIEYGNGNSVTTDDLTGPAGSMGVAGAPGAPGSPGMDGVDGEDGAGITQITSNGDGTLTIEYGNGNSVTTDDLTGPAGSMGVAGAPGAPGSPGMDGADGAGITQITSNGDGTLTIEYGNGNSVTTDDLTGPAGPAGADGMQGPQGDVGPTGDTGPAGADGTSGADGATWLTGSDDPGPGLGNDGDFYFQTDGHYYQKVAGSWNDIGLVDPDPNDDLLNSSVADGEITGTFDNLQISPAAIGLSNFSDMGATGPGAVMKWNGSSWELGMDNGEEYNEGTGVSITGNVISADNEAELWNANAIRGRPIGGMDPVPGQSYFLVNNGSTDSVEYKQLGGDISGDFSDISVQKLRGRPIGGMDPVPGQSYFLVNNGATDSVEYKQLGGDISGDFSNLSVQGIRGRPIGGMDPVPGQSYFMVINGGSDEYELVQLNGDVDGDFNSLELKLPLQKGGSFGDHMIDFTNNSTSSSTYGIHVLSSGEKAPFSVPSAFYDIDFTYPAALYGESSTDPNSDNAAAAVMGRAVEGAPNRGVGGWFQGISIGMVGVSYGQTSFAGILGIASHENDFNDNGSRYGGAFYGADNNSTNSNAALFADDRGARYAGYFSGDVFVSGQLDMLNNFSAADKFLRIDHPLEPTQKYLYHATVESPERKNIYDGNVTTDAEGYATVSLPDYFEALNTDFRYQLTVIGTFAQAIIAEKIENGQFVIRTNEPNIEVSWQVTGIRQDAFAKQNPFTPEVEKDSAAKGTYLHPEAFDLSETKGQHYSDEDPLNDNN